MKRAFNKKKINFLPSFRIIKYIFIFILFTFAFIKTYNELIYEDRFKDFIQNISVKFNYQFKVYEINTLYRVDTMEISKIVNQYLDQSIFLVPLEDISDSLNRLNWIKNVNLSTNFKNKIIVKIEEYLPIGLFSFNNQYFYFSEQGKIIDRYNKNINEDFIIFYGNEALNKANYFLKILKKINHLELLEIKEAYYINERRWNIKFTNDITVYLSEKNIEESIKNYIKLIKKLNNSEIKSIKNIDLRNNQKAIMSFK